MLWLLIRTACHKICFHKEVSNIKWIPHLFRVLIISLVNSLEYLDNPYSTPFYLIHHWVTSLKSTCSMETSAKLLRSYLIYSRSAMIAQAFSPKYNNFRVLTSIKTEKGWTKLTIRTPSKFVADLILFFFFFFFIFQRKLVSTFLMNQNSQEMSRLIFYER